ncbi:MAG: DUF501 domain-containing protein [Aquificae bacterium]|nr:DUF501 domain-containing protein [Aquificota bacterium]
MSLSRRFEPVLRLQLGKTPKGNYKVVKLCRHGFPQVLENPPLVDGKPFPTLFWLSCPHLVREVSKLEEKGWIRRFEERLRRDARFRGRYLKAHALERSLRKALLPPELPYRLKLKLIKGGIGGIESPLGVKCLHLHLASSMGGIPDPIGKEVLKLVGAPECSNALCGKLLREKDRKGEKKNF